MSIKPRFHLHCTVNCGHPLAAGKMMEECNRIFTEKKGSSAECEERIKASWMVYALESVLHFEIYSETREHADPGEIRWEEMCARKLKEGSFHPLMGGILRRAPVDWIVRRMRELNLTSVDFEELFPVE